MVALRDEIEILYWASYRLNDYRQCLLRIVHKTRFRPLFRCGNAITGLVMAGRRQRDDLQAQASHDKHVLLVALLRLQDAPWQSSQAVQEGRLGGTQPCFNGIMLADDAGSRVVRCIPTSLWNVNHLDLPSHAYLSRCLLVGDSECLYELRVEIWERWYALYSRNRENA